MEKNVVVLNSLNRLMIDPAIHAVACERMADFLSSLI